MLRTLLDRLLTTLPALAGVVVVSFLLTRVLPGDTAAYFAGPAATPRPSRRSAPSSASTGRCPSSSPATSPTSPGAISGARSPPASR